VSVDQLERVRQTIDYYPLPIITEPATTDLCRWLREHGLNPAAVASRAKIERNTVTRTVKCRVKREAAIGGGWATNPIWGDILHDQVTMTLPFVPKPFPSSVLIEAFRHGRLTSTELSERDG